MLRCVELLLSTGFYSSENQLTPLYCAMRKSSRHITFGILATLLFAAVSLQAQSYEKELAELAATVSKSLQTGERKKATVLDFMDLQGNVNELGRFFAEEISVALVMNRKGFAVVDRANLKTILAEHKLSISGLVDPKNAKQLGEFSGVDALVLGTITTLKEDVIVSIKIIATDTAEIVGAAKARIAKTKDIEALLTTAIASNSGEKSESNIKPQPGGAPTQAGQTITGSPQLDLLKLAQVDKNSAQVGDLFIRVESVRPIHNHVRNRLMATLVLVNKNTSMPMLASIRVGNRYYSTLTDSHGKVFPTEGKSDIIGIGTGGGTWDGTTFRDTAYVAEDFTEIEPGKSIKITIPYGVAGSFNYTFAGGKFIDEFPLGPPPYRLQFSVAVGTEVNSGKLVNGKKSGVLIEIEK